MVYKAPFIFLLCALVSSVALAAEQQARLTRVDVLQIAAQPMELTSSYLGQVKPFRRSKISAQVAGQLETVPVSLGQSLKQDQVLAKIDTTRLALTYKLGLSNYQLAKAEYEREAKLFEKKLTSKSKLTQQKNRMEVSYYQMKLSQADLENSELKAPFGGVLSAKKAEVGEYIKKGNQLFEVMDLSKVKVQVNVPERDVGFASLGKPVNVSVDALGHKAFAGTIDSISLQADTKSRSFEVQVLVDNPKQEILSGMLGRVKMITQSLSDQVLIPRDTVLQDEQGSYVYLAEASVIKKRAIQLGHGVGNRVQVLGGLNPGELLVVVGQQMINHNEKVKINQNRPQLVKAP